MISARLVGPWLGAAAATVPTAPRGDEGGFAVEWGSEELEQELSLDNLVQLHLDSSSKWIGCEVIAPPLSWSRDLEPAPWPSIQPQALGIEAWWAPPGCPVDLLTTSSRSHFAAVWRLAQGHIYVIPVSPSLAAYLDETDRLLGFQVRFGDRAESEYPSDGAPSVFSMAGYIHLLQSRATNLRALSTALTRSDALHRVVAKAADQAANAAERAIAGEVVAVVLDPNVDFDLREADERSAPGQVRFATHHVAIGVALVTGRPTVWDSPP